MTGAVTEGEEATRAAERQLRAFEWFWRAYPRKQGKRQALDAWLALEETLHKKGFTAIARGLVDYTEDQQWQQEDGRYVPMPARFLRERMWEDKAPLDDIPVGHHQSAQDTHAPRQRTRDTAAHAGVDAERGDEDQPHADDLEGDEALAQDAHTLHHEHGATEGADHSDRLAEAA